jgi:hypothetical protein
MVKCHRLRAAVALVVLALLLQGARGRAQMVAGPDMPGFKETFALDHGYETNDFKVEEIGFEAGGRTMANILWPGEQARVTLHFTNTSGHAIEATGAIQVVRYGTSVPEGEVWVPHAFLIRREGSVPLTVKLPAGGTGEIAVTPPIPETLGGYGLVVDLGEHGRAFAAAVVRVVRPDRGRVQFPTYALDMTWDEFMNEGVFVLFEKLGVKGARMGGQFELKTEPDYEASKERLDRYMRWARAHDVTVMLTLGDGDGWSDQPLGRPRPWLGADGKMLDTKDDRAWMPKYDGEFQHWVTEIATRYGWPRGNLNAVELWNEPWEASSISGWGADIQRYREIFEHMALGVEEARARAGVKVLIGGTCSSSNARDKLFPDGSNRFLKWLDFISIHYQALAADPALEPGWVHRKSPYGPVRVWDTESWIANSEDRVAGVIASMRAQGQSRTAGVFDGNVYQSHNVKTEGKIFPVVQAWAPAAAVAATQKFIGQRAFRRLLFPNGLPWVFVFDGLPAAKRPEDDGTAVVVGDLGRIYDRERPLFRTVSVSKNAHMRIANPDGTIAIFDFYGNRVWSTGHFVDVPLDGKGYYLRSTGRAGSFARMLSAIRKARVEGLDPVEMVAHDLTAPIEQRPSLRLTLTNVLNRPVRGRLEARLGDVDLRQPGNEIVLQPNETRTVELAVTGGKAAPGNTYPLTAVFNAGADGLVEHREDLHVNWIARRTLKVDGDLADWDGVLPEPIPGVGLKASLTEEAWLPYRDFARGENPGASSVYLAYDDKYFYFAAKIADATPDPGMVRFAHRDDDAYFYPDEATTADGKRLAWPTGVRHYSYRKNFDIPSGSGEHDNVLIAFNVRDKKRLLPNPSGVMPHFIVYEDTDYEYALNPVAPEYGGGTEIWRLQSPGMPRKHFFPRQPASPVDGGPVAGQLAMRRTDTTRVVEAAIPWSEMPDVRKRISLGETVKFTVRINDNKGNAHELAAGRSVSKYNSFTFHDDWQDHWANELEFGVEK